MKTQDELHEIRKEDEKKLRGVQVRADDLATRRGDEIQKVAQKIKDKIQSLIDKKHDIFDAPYSKAHTLAQAKIVLKEKRREWFIENVLVKHLQYCQIHAGGFFADPIMRVDMGREDRLWKMLFNVITEKDLEEAAAMLPDIGMTHEEKEAEIRKIDAEIEALEGQLEKDMKKWFPGG